MDFTPRELDILKLIAQGLSGPEIAGQLGAAYVIPVIFVPALMITHVVAFYLLTGRPVFEGTSAYHLIARHLNDPPPAPSTVTTSTIPGELDAIILACLRKRPAERPASAIALSESLARLAA